MKCSLMIIQTLLRYNFSESKIFDTINMEIWFIYEPPESNEKDDGRFSLFSREFVLHFGFNVPVGSWGTIVSSGRTRQRFGKSV